ncbi:hypothetical protein DBR11_04520 [Pedobacter sp. HMWF019]|uniref:DUF4856 domain-containing protein n=1 Tax=Pedobacter sp. HMWF019 TaxID=2056856 RepID=UPI000D39C8BC|nr:DUF4856 domain-containing protein [Pedobacter sp. HMWF019]PTT02519.1 hypothetical protein DBR11_04520 [Pedobacter sp. HMWF019]
MKKIGQAIGLSIAVALLVAGCKKSDSPADTVPNYTVPTTYNFAGANFADATTRLGMVTEMSNLMKNALTGVLDGQKLNDMFVNSNATFATAGYNTSGLQIKNQCFLLLQTDVPKFIDSLVKVSQSSQPASRGVAGVGASSANAASKYALTGLGVNYAQVFNKSIMGGLICYQIVTTMASGDISEHNWDLAFGYWGVPIDFPTNKTGAKLWGSYTTQVDAGYHANKILMDAFLKGRAAITNKDTKTRDEQAAIILQTFERLTGAAALQEVQEIKESMSDNITRNSRLSECYGFVNSLRYNPKRKITDAQIDAILALFPKSFYDLTLTDVNNIRDAVAKQYNFEDVKDIL